MNDGGSYAPSSSSSSFCNLDFHNSHLSLTQPFFYNFLEPRQGSVALRGSVQFKK